MRVYAKKVKIILVRPLALFTDLLCYFIKLIRSMCASTIVIIHTDLCGSITAVFKSAEMTQQTNFTSISNHLNYDMSYSFLFTLEAHFLLSFEYFCLSHCVRAIIIGPRMSVCIVRKYY